MSAVRAAAASLTAATMMTDQTVRGWWGVKSVRVRTGRGPGGGVPGHRRARGRVDYVIVGEAASVAQRTAWRVERWVGR